MTLSLGHSFSRPYTGGAVPEKFALDARKRAETMLRPPTRGAVRPRLVLANEYRARLLRIIDEMDRSITYWLKAAYRGQSEGIAKVAGDRLAYDEPTANVLDVVIRRLRRRWLRRFGNLSNNLAEYFATSVKERTDAQLKDILRRGGMSVKFQLTPAVREVLPAIVKENVALIRSIPEQYLGKVEGVVMRSVTAGRDLSTLTKELQEQYGVTRRRANTIAIDQCNKATGAIARARYIDLGIAKAIWCHSHAGFEPRPTHLANDGKEYDIVEGWFDTDPKVRRHIHPGELIRCRCFSRPVLPG